MTESEQVPTTVDSQGAHEVEPASGDSTPGEQSELDLGVVATGHAGVDSALAALDGLHDRPIAEHPDVFEQVHRGLLDAMTSVDDDTDLGPDEVGGRTDP
jgi:hypothetical protein